MTNIEEKIFNSLPDYVKYALRKLELNGFEAFAVGGSIRDILLNRKCSDFDITTDATPTEIKKVFKNNKSISVGESFGTVIVVVENRALEITTYRKDSFSKDNRHPDSVSYSKSYEDDALRRDFTINQMAYSLTLGFKDYYDGINDLNKKIIRTVGEPEKRIEEDYLRILRAVRFSSSLGFDLDKSLKESIIKNKDKIDKLSKERIRDEFIKMLLSKKPSDSIRLLNDLGILEIIDKNLSRMLGFDQKSSFHNLDLFEHSLKTLDETEENIYQRLAALYHDTGKIDTFFLDERGEGRFFNHQKVSSEYAREFLKKYRFSNRTIDKVTNLIERHMDACNTYTKKSIKKLFNRMGENIYDLFYLQEADIKATNHQDF